jgi:hypothetical protein
MAEHTVGLAFTATTVLDLEAGEVSVVLDDLDERHLSKRHDVVSA